MTQRTNARVAGFTYLFYIAVAFPSMLLFNRATNAEGTAATLTRIAEHASDVRLAIVLTLLSCFSALVVGVALYGITRGEDPELAVLALACRVCEGVIGATGLRTMQGLLWLATEGTAAGGPDVAANNALGAFLLMPTRSALVSALFFAVGSTLFSYLLLRGRMIPVPLAWLGVLASVLLVVGLPLQLIGLLHSPATSYMWLPMLAFEVPLGLWLLIKGVVVRAPTPRPSPSG